MLLLMVEGGGERRDLSEKEDGKSHNKLKGWIFLVVFFMKAWKLIEKFRKYKDYVELEAGSRWRRRIWSLRLSTRLDPCGQYGQRKGRSPEWVSMWRSKFCLRFTPEMNRPHTGHCTPTPSSVRGKDPLRPCKEETHLKWPKMEGFVLDLNTDVAAASENQYALLLNCRILLCSLPSGLGVWEEFIFLIFRAAGVVWTKSSTIWCQWVRKHSKFKQYLLCVQEPFSKTVKKKK